jgi:hypothetical protein
MGRTAETFAQWQGQSAEVWALLEPNEVILRGGIRDRVPRASISRMTVDGGWLTLATHRGPLVLELGEVEAAKWLAALQKPPATLAEKLGVSATCRAYVVGPLDDAELATAVAGVQAATVAEAGILLAVLEQPGDLDAAFAVAKSAPNLMLWCVYPKGKAAVTDAMVRDYLRGRGYVDSKSCAVSDRLTATRYGMRKAG